MTIMNRVIMIGFEYNKTMHYALVRVKQSEDHLAYCIMPYDSDLSELLQEQNIIRQADGYLEYHPSNQIQRRLMEGICKSLGGMLSLPVREGCTKSQLAL